MAKRNISSVVQQHPSIFRFLSWIYNTINFKNKLLTKGTKLKTGTVKINGLKIYSNGKDNRIIIEDFACLKNCSLRIFGNNNLVQIHKSASLNQVDIYMEDDNNIIQIGEYSRFEGKAQLAAIEGTKITIGDHCLFSSDLHFRTGDSHSVTDLNNKRINPSMDITIGNHVWIGTRVICLKNTLVEDNSVVAAGSLLCKQYGQQNCIIGGVPGKIIRQNINWNIQRLPINE